MSAWDLLLVLGLFGGACWAFYRLGREQGWDRGWDEGMLTGRRLLREDREARERRAAQTVADWVAQKSTRE